MMDLVHTVYEDRRTAYGLLIVGLVIFVVAFDVGGHGGSNLQRTGELFAMAAFVRISHQAFMDFARDAYRYGRHKHASVAALPRRDADNR